MGRSFLTTMLEYLEISQCWFLVVEDVRDQHRCSPYLRAVHRCTCIIAIFCFRAGSRRSDVPILVRSLFSPSSSQVHLSNSAACEGSSETFSKSHSTLCQLGHLKPRVCRTDSSSWSSATWGRRCSALVCMLGSVWRSRLAQCLQLPISWKVRFPQNLTSFTKPFTVLWVLCELS